MRKKENRPCTGWILGAIGAGTVAFLMLLLGFAEHFPPDRHLDDRPRCGILGGRIADLGGASDAAIGLGRRLGAPGQFLWVIVFHSGRRVDLPGSTDTSVADGNLRPLSLDRNAMTPPLGGVFCSHV